MSGPLDYAEGWQLAQALGDVVRERQARIAEVERIMAGVQRRSRDAHDQLSATLGPWRELVIALTDGAGNSGRHPLGPAIEAAKAAMVQVDADGPEPGAATV